MATDVTARESAAVLGFGFVPLDVVIGENAGIPPRLRAGGTCGNVMSILSWLGSSVAVGTVLGADIPGRVVLEDLSRLGVSVESVMFSATKNTPVVIHRVLASKGERTHKFQLTCPTCGSFLPRFIQPTIKQALELLNCNPEGKFLFLDRVVPSSVHLARAAKALGLIVMLEPNKLGMEATFRKLLEYVDIVKCSVDSPLAQIVEAEDTGVAIQIVTAGRVGLKYRIHKCRWRKMPALPAVRVIDEAGAGDWCTAGFIKSLLCLERSVLRGMKDAEIRPGLIWGQALAAYNCAFEGARGAMYSQSSSEEIALARQFPHSQVMCSVGHSEISEVSNDSFKCAHCQ